MKEGVSNESGFGRQRGRGGKRTEYGCGVKVLGERDEGGKYENGLQYGLYKSISPKCD